MSEVSSETCASRLTANVTNINFLFLAYQVQYRLAGRNFLENMQVYFASKPSGNFWEFVAVTRILFVSWFPKALPFFIQFPKALPLGQDMLGLQPVDCAEIEMVNKKMFCVSIMLVKLFLYNVENQNYKCKTMHNLQSKPQRGEMIIAEMILLHPIKYYPPTKTPKG